jgi:hypothetical protein
VKVERVADGFHAEMPGTRVFESAMEETLLTESDKRTLVDAGWEPPFRDVLQYHWWINLPDISAESLASMIVVALRHVQRVDGTSSLEFVIDETPDQTNRDELGGM